MAKKGFFRRIAEKLGFIKPEPIPSTVSVPSKPDIPPHPRRAPESELSVDERVERFRHMNADERRRQRPQDEESEFWRLYDRG